MPVYRGSLADGITGSLVPNDPYAWYARLDWLMRNQSYRRRLTRGVRQAFLDGGTIATQAVERRTALQAAIQRVRQSESAA